LKSEIPGASTINRPGFLSLMRAADGMFFDVIPAEDLDRISAISGLDTRRPLVAGERFHQSPPGKSLAFSVFIAKKAVLAG
jgi:hypothetical protein